MLIYRFKITLLEETDAGWVSSDDFTLENCGNNDVIVKFESVYYKFKDDDNFVSVDSEEDVRSITDKKVFFMKMICDGLGRVDTSYANIFNQTAIQRI